MGQHQLRLRTRRPRTDSSVSRPFVVGVTGGIGSGKSTVCALFAREVPVFSADRVARAVMEDDPAVRAEVVTLLGPGAYDADGRLDAAFVAGRVFADEDVLRRLNAITHPPTLLRLEQMVDAEAVRGARLVVIESALIFEAGIRDRFDYVVAVTAPEEQVLARLADGDPEAEARLRIRMARQLSPEDKAARADFSIRNEGTMEALEQRAIFVLGLIRRLCGA